MSEKINKEELVTLLENPQKSDVERPAKDSEERTTIAIENLMKQFVDNFSIFHSKERKGHKYNAVHKEKTMTNGVILNVLSGEETENAISFNEEDEEKILVVIEKDIQEFKDKQT